MSSIVIPEVVDLVQSMSGEWIKLRKGTLRQPGWSSFGWLNEMQISIKRYHGDAKSKLCITKFFFKWTETFPRLIKQFSEALMGSVFGRFVKAFSPMNIVCFALVSSTGQQNPMCSRFAFSGVALRRMRILQ